MSISERILKRAILFRPEVVQRRLDEIRGARIVSVVPNTWQVSLGVLRMVHRVLFRADTVGVSKDKPVRDTWRAKVLQFRPLRSGFLLRERAIAPLDLSGLLSSPERVVCHLLGAHHDGNQFAYDLEMLAATPERVEEALALARAVVHRDDARSRWLRDLCVFEGYHENLVQACERALCGDYRLSASEHQNPDISFEAYLAWCSHQPSTLEATLELVARRQYHPMHGRLDRDASASGVAGHGDFQVHA